MQQLPHICTIDTSEYGRHARNVAYAVEIHFSVQALNSCGSEKEHKHVRDDFVVFVSWLEWHYV